MTSRHLNISLSFTSGVGVNCGSTHVDMFNLQLDFTLTMLKLRPRPVSAEEAEALIEHFL